MAKQQWIRVGWVIAASVLLFPACGSTVTPTATGQSPGIEGGASGASVDDASLEEASLADASVDDADDLDACVPTDVKKCRDATFIALGSKCLTKCPVHTLSCDPRFWKGECTHPCSADADCQDTGSPGVCGKDNQCHRPCDSGAKPCQRTHFDCVGDPGHLYCASSFPNPHLDGGDDGGDTIDDDGGDVTPDATVD